MGQLVSGEANLRCFDPADSIINFAVPSPSKLRSFNRKQFPQSLHPGVIHEALQTHKEEDMADYNICNERKKLVPGLDNTITIHTKV